MVSEAGGSQLRRTIDNRGGLRVRAKEGGVWLARSGKDVGRVG